MGPGKPQTQKHLSYSHQLKNTYVEAGPIIWSYISFSPFHTTSLPWNPAPA